MTGSLFRRLMMVALLLVAATLFAVDYTLTAYVAREQASRTDQRLTTEALLLTGELDRIPQQELAAWVAAAAARSGAHVTVMDSGGTALADSGAGPVDEYSVSHPVARQLVLRLASPRSAPDPATQQTRRRIFAISLGAALLALGIAFLVSHSLSLRVSRMKRLAEGMLAGVTQDRLAYDSSDELGSLERSLAGVALQLTKLVDRLRVESARREAILSGMAEGVLAVDHELRVTFCNTALLRATGFRGTTFEGLSLLELVRDPRLYELLRSVLSTGEDHNLRVRLSSVHARTFEVHATPIDMPPGRGALAILHDVSDLERLEQVRKDFVANVSHEFRTPLAGIIGYAETLLDGALDDDRNKRRFVEIIRANAVRLGSIASDLLVLSELESGTDPPEPEVISVRGVLEAALLTVQAEAKERGVSLVRDGLEDVYVSGSRLRLEQALLNLVANAIKFNRAGGEVRVTGKQDQDGRIAISVSDTGVGIPSEDLPRIFERFYRVDKARSRQVGGTGLGLSIVKHVVERMNGSVGVESQLGRGSKFTLWLPAVSKPRRERQLVTS